MRVVGESDPGASVACVGAARRAAPLLVQRVLLALAVLLTAFFALERLAGWVRSRQTSRKKLL